MHIISSVYHHSMNNPSSPGSRATKNHLTYNHPKQAPHRHTSLRAQRYMAEQTSGTHSSPKGASHHIDQYNSPSAMPGPTMRAGDATRRRHPGRMVLTLVAPQVVLPRIGLVASRHVTDIVHPRLFPTVCWLMPLQILRIQESLPAGFTGKCAVAMVARVVREVRPRLATLAAGAAREAGGGGQV